MLNVDKNLTADQAEEVLDSSWAVARRNYWATAVARWDDTDGNMVLGMSNGDVVTHCFLY